VVTKTCCSLTEIKTQLHIIALCFVYLNDLPNQTNLSCCYSDSPSSAGRKTPIFVVQLLVYYLRNPQYEDFFLASEGFPETKKQQFLLSQICKWLVQWFRWTEIFYIH